MWKRGAQQACGYRPLACIVLLLVPFGARAQTEFTTMLDPHTQEAITLMMSFAERTGLTSERPKQRYLWTDAFAVCNFLGLARTTREERFSALALRLVEQVHHTLGRHRRDDSRTGWISGLSEPEGEAHPTRGGLRIGKELPERRPNEPFDERLEWDRDGQYFHYLTKWMHALDQVTRATGQFRFNAWARELAETAYHAFTYLPSTPGSTRRMYWKMSIDLKRPLVPSMGQHDPLDGYVTYLELRATAAKQPDFMSGPTLNDETAHFAAMIDASALATADPLGLGGLLTDAYRLEQLGRQEARFDDRLLEALLAASLTGLQYFARSGELHQPADQRLAFRELGLAIGLHALQRLWQAEQREPRRSAEVETRLQALMQYAPLHAGIESFWRDPVHRQTRAWSEHRDINEVMLATVLVPEGFLVIGSPR